MIKEQLLSKNTKSFKTLSVGVCLVFEIATKS